MFKTKEWRRVKEDLQGLKKHLGEAFVVEVSRMRKINLGRWLSAPLIISTILYVSFLTYKYCMSLSSLRPIQKEAIYTQSYWLSKSKFENQEYLIINHSQFLILGHGDAGCDGAAITFKNQNDNHVGWWIDQCGDIHKHYESFVP